VSELVSHAEVEAANEHADVCTLQDDPDYRAVVKEEGVFCEVPASRLCCGASWCWIHYPVHAIGCGKWSGVVD